MKKKVLLLVSAGAAFIAGVVVSCHPAPNAPPGAPVSFDRFPGFSFATPTSEAELAAYPVDFFKGMDGNVALTDDEIKGRNTWIMWTSDNAKFWDWLSDHSYGVLDLLKILDSRNRSTRFKVMGLINDPGYKQATKPDQFGLWLDVPAADSKPDPKLLQEYGDSSGIVGLRLFPNPKFDAAAQSHWNADKYYSDPNYYNDPKLVRPYMVGMACGFCHVAPDPVHPPADPENPQWTNLSSYVGNQFFKVSKIFGAGLQDDNFILQLLNSSPRGTLDTSFIATDHLNNPRTMNGIYNVASRLAVTQTEHLTGGALTVPGTKPDMTVPHILKDGSDSIGLLGALSRVFVNIGEDSDDWLKDLNYDPLVGREPYHPFDVTHAQNTSVYWRATGNRVGDLAKFFLKAAVPHHLRDAPGGSAYLTNDAPTLARGKILFAENCASCHSSKMPPNVSDLNSPAAKDWFRKEVMKPDFLDGNYLSNDRRYPVSEIGTNANSPSATNSTAGHIWDSFSSQTYKNLPSVGQIDCVNPVTGTHFNFTMPSGGPGYIRVPSLISLWASAPFFQNNTLGEFNKAPDGTDLPDPSVAARMKAFNDAVTKLLWPAKRLGMDSIWRTDRISYLEIPTAQLPKEFQLVFHEPYLKIGPIPVGTPINLLSNLDINLKDKAKTKKLIELAIAIKARLLDYQANKLGARLLDKGRLTDAEIAKIFEPLVPRLLELNKCPDFIEDKGHYYGTQLSDPDKKALIEFLKWM